MSADKIVPDPVEDEPPKNAAAKSAGDPLSGVLDEAHAWVEKHPGVLPINQIFERVTAMYLDAIDVDAPPEPSEIEIRLVAILNLVVQADNRHRPARNKMPLLRNLTNAQIAQIVHRLHVIREVTPGGADSDDDLGVLAIYQPRDRPTDGPGVGGIYRRCDLGLLEDMVQSLNYQATARDYAEVERLVRLAARKVSETRDKDLVPLRSCVYNYRTQQRLPYAPDLVFLAKYAADLPETTPSVPVIINEDGSLWDAEVWLGEVLTDPDTRLQVLQIIGSALRPNVDWYKLVIFLAETGRNGKGSILELIRHMVGRRLVASVPLGDYEKEFGLQSIIGKRANLIDEEDAGAYMKAGTARLKQIIVNEPVMINRKHKAPINYRPSMVTIACWNEFVVFKDKTDALHERLLFVRFHNRFTGTQRNGAIKADYLRRREVIDYFTWRVLVDLPAYYRISEPEASRTALNEFRSETDAVVAWWEAYGHKFARDFLPTAMLYAHYVAHLRLTNPSGRPVSQKAFTRTLATLVDPEIWVMPKRPNGNYVELSTSMWVVENEPILDEFDTPEVSRWQVTYRHDRREWVLPPTAPRRTTGLLRRTAFDANNTDGSTPRSVSEAAQATAATTPSDNPNTTGQFYDPWEESE
ncbi:MAG: DNA primase family protein [Pseudonocardiaceae bacterium]